MTHAAEIHRDTWTPHNGKLCTIDGLRCRVEVSEYEAVYPYRHQVITVYATPTPAARRTAAYRATREQLRDDWSTDLLDSAPEVAADVLRQLT